ncbi:hypothetical protein ACFYKX_10470 [Cytobacillus sp. FJAT-54145]|uniref:Uncharacterized protein n=1 Tax=Cytobacillus spartinae TaxID=3299023 RepID=A0ABW6KA26_9BACI
MNSTSSTSLHDFQEGEYVYSTQYRSVFTIEKVFTSHLYICDEKGKKHGYSNYGDLRRATCEEIQAFQIKRHSAHTLVESPSISHPISL